VTVTTSILQLLGQQQGEADGAPEPRLPGGFALFGAVVCVLAVLVVAVVAIVAVLVFTGLEHVGE
jgi:hypothetical protein